MQGRNMWLTYRQIEDISSQVHLPDQTLDLNLRLQVSMFKRYVRTLQKF